MTILVRVKGGPGSGNWGHAGRPGMVGGSGGTGGSFESIPSWDTSKKYELAKESRSREPSKAEGKALYYYIGDGYKSINRSLRNSVELSDRDESAVRALDTYIESGTLSDNVIMYRGISPKCELGKHFGELHGSTIVDNGYASASIDDLSAKTFAGYYSDDPSWHGVVMVIQVPKGTHVGVITGQESEFILPRGSKFRVVSENSRQVGASYGLPAHERRELLVGLVL